VGGKPLRVVGVYQRAENILEPPGPEIAAIAPFETARRAFRVDRLLAPMIWRAALHGKCCEIGHLVMQPMQSGNDAVCGWRARSKAGRVENERHMKVGIA